MQATARLTRSVPYAVQVAIVAAAYFVTARLSLALAIPPGYATAVWPPSGIALAAALLLGGRIWPGIWIGAALANVAIEASLVSAALIASGNTLEALAARWLIRRHAANPAHFERGEDVVKFVLLCALSAAIAATVATVALAIGHSLPWEQGFRNWWTWWQGDATGMIIVAPLILSLSVRDAVSWSLQKKSEAAAFWLLLLVTVAAVSADDASRFAPFSLTFLSLPFIIWAAFRFGQREVTMTIVVVCAVAVWYTVQRQELFGSAPLNELLLMLLTFISLVVITGLLLAVAVSERGRALEDLRRRNHSLQSQMDKRAYSDPLTGLPNGALFREHLAQLLKVAAESNRKTAVALVDVDRFKTINDTLGRQAGDELLRQIAERIVPDDAASNGAIVGRLSRDRFAIAVHGFESENAVARATEKNLALWFGVPYRLGENEFRISARMGLALSPDDGVEADVLFMHAESALKKAKATGDSYLFYTQKMSERITEKLSFENRLRRALEREEFVLHYQPKVDVDTRQVTGLEALIRWQSPELGLVPPNDFIPLLEETGLILDVGSWALRRAALDQMIWARDDAITVPRIAVNVSAMQLRQSNFVELVQKAIGSAANLSLIDLEITESRIMEEIEANIDKLRNIRALGIGIAIDDFGTGYSSLSYLAKLPVQTLKIDRSFISRMLEDDDAMALVQTIISLAQSLKLTTVAEGVESEAAADVLGLLRCDQMQGYLVSKPLPRGEITAFLRNT